MNLEHNIKHVLKTIEDAERLAQRPPHSVLLMAVSKQQPASRIAQAFDCGIKDFGENYLQEALPKIQQLAGYPITWHFIGPIQSNKASLIASHFDWVHSVNREKVALALNDHRKNKPLQVCIQVNVQPEESKSGIAPEAVEALAEKIAALPNLQLRGLMTVPPQNKSSDELFSLFTELKDIMLYVNKKLEFQMDTLSMGMSDDIVPAIQAGSTIVRIGRAIFGERPNI